jgi:endoglucanase
LALREVIRRLSGNLKNITLYGIFTCQEEIGARGARTAAFGKKLDFGITLDTVPIQNKDEVEYGTVDLRKGPVIRLIDWFPGAKMGMISNKLLTERLRQVAKATNIPHQTDILTGTYLDSCTAHLTENGLPCASICFPRRYSHTQVEMSYMPDIENSIRLICEFLKDVDRKPIIFGKIYK